MSECGLNMSEYVRKAGFQDWKINVRVTPKVSSRILTKAGVFAGLAKLQELSLQRNRIKEVQVGAFDGLANLEELILNHNPIQDPYRHLGSWCGESGVWASRPMDFD